jgi:hypothetical protein
MLIRVWEVDENATVGYLEIEDFLLPSITVAFADRDLCCEEVACSSWRELCGKDGELSKARIDDWIERHA